MNRAALIEDCELAQEQAERRALVDFAAFVRLLWPVVEPAPLEWGWHMRVICTVLQELAEGKIRRLVINIPPGFSKSLLACVFLPAWIWLHRPAERMLFLSHDGDLASRDSRRTRILLQSPEYQRLLARIPRPWTFARDQNEKVNFENSARGFRYCGSLTSGITGKLEAPSITHTGSRAHTGKTRTRLSQSFGVFGIGGTGRARRICAEATASSTTE